MITFIATLVLVTAHAQNSGADKAGVVGPGDDNAAVVSSADDKAAVALTHSTFGCIVGRAGDVNKDGIADIVIGDPDHPQIWIVSGKDGSTLQHVRLTSEESFARFRVDGGIDVDGDGVPDVLLAVNPYASNHPGALYLVSGKSGEVLRRITIRGPAGMHGDWARFVGDFDHDGVPDVGALTLQTDKQLVMLTIYSSRSGESLLAIPSENPRSAEVGGIIDAGDVDGDGTNDLAIVLDAGKDGHGFLRLYSGAKRAPLWEHVSPLVGQPYSVLESIGDVDGDHVSDLAVGFYDSVDVVSTKSGASLYHLESHPSCEPSSGVHVTVSGEALFGCALAALGDIDRDGAPDFAISETEADAFSGAVHAVSDRNGHEIWTAYGRNEGEVHHFGHAMAAVGDVDADGISDLVVGSWEGQAGEPGLARVISGKSGALLFQFRRKGDDVVVTKRVEPVSKPR